MGFSLLSLAGNITRKDWSSWSQFFILQFSSVQLLSRVWLFVTPWTAACQASLSITSSWSLLKLMSIESVMPSNHLILCRPLLLPPLFFPSIRVFSSESVLCTRWPEYWSFSFSLSPSNEYSGLISFRMDWLDLLAVQGTLHRAARTYTGLGKQTLGGHKENLVCPRRKEQWPHKTLTQTCPWVSRSLRQRCGSVACCRVGSTECSSVCMGCFEGSCHYLHYLHHSFYPWGLIFMAEMCSLVLVNCLPLWLEEAWKEGVWVGKMTVDLVGQEHFILLAKSFVVTYLKIPVVIFVDFLSRLSVYSILNISSFPE